MTLHYNRSSEKEKRRKLRNNATRAERRLWQYLKGKQLAGYKFRRQYGVDQFVIDFYCPKVKLAVEIDGPSHYREGAREYDEAREAHIRSYGVTFLRFTNWEVYENIEGVLQAILKKAQELEGTTP